MDVLLLHEAVPRPEQHREDSSACGVAWQDARRRPDGFGKSPIDVADTFGGPSQAEPGHNFVGRAGMAKRGSRRLMEDAVVGLGQVELCPSSRVFVTPSKEGRSGRKFSNLALLAIRRRRQRVKDGLLPSAENKRCNGDWPGLAGVPLRDANHAPREYGVT